MLHSGIDQALKRLVAREHDTDGTCQEGEEGQAHEFDAHAEEQLESCGAAYVTVADCGDRRKNKIESIGIYFNGKFILLNGQVSRGSSLS